MTGALYFCQAVAGVLHRRYHVGRWLRAGVFEVTHTQASRPDGTEIAPPAAWRLAPAPASTAGAAHQAAAASAPGSGVRCRRCGIEKRHSAFEADRRMLDGRTSICRACIKAQRLDRAAARQKARHA